MSRRALIATPAPVIALVLTLGATQAAAQSRQEMFAQIDTNNDRMLQFTELETFRGTVFDRLDVNANGFADPEELEALQEQAAANGRVAPGAVDPTRADGDGDGQISRMEFAAAIPDRLRNADSNGDGALSRRELMAARR